MEVLRVTIDELDWEDPVVPWGPIYQDKPFSGIVFDQWGSIYYERSYLEGELDGRLFMLNTSSNRLIKEMFFSKGISVG
ncbi:MAG TPA: hypothetical protein VGE24_05125, partial [Emticicia sp.]